MSRQDETPTPWAENWQAQRTLALLQHGPKSTIELQKLEPLVHVARQIWELRHWYGWQIKTRRLPNKVALYELVVADDARERGKLVYRALRSAGPVGLSRVELEEILGWDTQTVLETLQWLRFKRVDIGLIRSELLGEPNRFTLVTPLPAAWEP